jgi:hypothetical protein
MNASNENKNHFDLRIEAIRSRLSAIAIEQDKIAKELDEIENLQQLIEKCETEIASQKYDDDVYKTIFALEWGTMRLKEPKKEK